MISTLIVVVHIIVALTLILIVLLQVGKGGSIGAAFGGGGSSQTLFGSRGPATFLSRLTTIAAALFMVTSLLLAYFSYNEQSASITDRAPAAESALPAQEATSEPTPESAPIPMQPVDQPQK